MGILDTMKGRRVYVDTAPFIYYIEKNPAYASILDRFFTILDRAELNVVTSTLTLAEVLVKPYRLKQRVLAEHYEAIFENISHLTLLPACVNIARLAAKFRATDSLLTPDAIHWATAVHCDADFFLTNDRDFRAMSKRESNFPELVFINDL